MNRLFERTPAGLLVEVAPEGADQARSIRRFSTINFVADVLWTDEEEAVRDAEERAATADRQEAARVIADKTAARQAAIAKLGTLGLSEREIAALIAG